MEAMERQQNYQTNQPAVSVNAGASLKTSLVLPIVLMASPIVGLVIAGMTYAVSDVILRGDITNINANNLANIINIIVFCLGAIATFLMAPCLIIGLIVLFKRLKNRKN